jgi:hypothetical protein
MSQLIFVLLFGVAAALFIGVLCYIFSGFLGPRLPLEGEGQEPEAPEEFDGLEFPPVVIPV